jgi:hypothetical protein
MEIENSTSNLVNTLKNTIPTPDIINSTVDPVDTASNFFPKLILIIIIIAFIGGFVFIYLAKGDKSFTEFATPYLNYLGIDIGSKTTDTTTTTTTYDYTRDTSSRNSDYERTRGTTGIRGAPRDTTIDTTTQIDTIPIYTTTTRSETRSETKDDDASVECDNPKKEKLLKALNNAAQTAEYMADDASSSIQSINKSKWCFIGEEKGVRNCVLLNDAQKCMSGDIFPSRDICINPKIRT